jgi:hypothetical protein
MTRAPRVGRAAEFGRCRAVNPGSPTVGCYARPRPTTGTPCWPAARASADAAPEDDDDLVKIQVSVQAGRLLGKKCAVADMTAISRGARRIGAVRPAAINGQPGFVIFDGERVDSVQALPPGTSFHWSRII